MSDMFDAVAAAKETQSVKKEHLEGLSGLLEQRDEMLLKTEILERELKLAKKRLDEMETKTIPEFMLSSGIRKFTTDDGVEVGTKKTYYASISQERADAVYEWMEQHGHLDLYKVELKKTFTAGEKDLAFELIKVLNEMGYPMSHKEFVHHATLKAFVREQIEKDYEEGEEPFPQELFGVHVEERVTVKKPKGS